MTWRHLGSVMDGGRGGMLRDGCLLARNGGAAWQNVTYVAQLAAINPRWRFASLLSASAGLPDGHYDFGERRMAPH